MKNAGTFHRGSFQINRGWDAWKKADIANNILNDFRQIEKWKLRRVVSMDGTRAFDKKRSKVLETDMIKALSKEQRLNIYEESGRQKSAYTPRPAAKR